MIATPGAAPALVFHYDLVDPLSWLMEAEVTAWEEATGRAVARAPFELRPPPAPLLTPDDPEWAARWEAAAARAEETAVGRAIPALPPWTPWSRKAHELVLHGRELDRETAVREAVFRAFFEDGSDVGRVDVLVEIGDAVGLDRTRCKAVLDVDRHARQVAEATRSLLARGVAAPPALLAPDGVLEGFHDRAALATLL